MVNVEFFFFDECDKDMEDVSNTHIEVFHNLTEIVSLGANPPTWKANNQKEGINIKNMLVLNI